jgi:hypothetical protein
VVKEINIKFLEGWKGSNRRLSLFVSIIGVGWGNSLLERGYPYYNRELESCQVLIKGGEMLRPEPSYAQDVRAIARDIIKGRAEQGKKRLVKWADIWSFGRKTITPKDMFGDVLAFINETNGALDGQRHTLRCIEKWKSYGKETYYSFELGLLPVDEAIAEQELRIARLENAGSLLLELEVGD